MAKVAYKEKELERLHGDLHDLIPEMVNKHGQSFTAVSLGVSQHFISTWLKKNGYVAGVVYVKMTDKAREALKEVQ